MKVSILIPTFNSSKTLPLVLESLSIQTMQNFEVLVCDGGSTDNTIEIAEKWGAKIICRGIRNISLARNILLDNALGDILVFIDSDVIVPPYFIEAHVNVHTVYPEVNVLSSSVVTISEPPKIEELKKLSMPSYIQIEPAKSMRNFWQMASSLKRRVVRKVRYDTDFFRAHEDGYFFYATLRAGFKIHRARNVIVFHYKPKKRKSLREDLINSFRDASFPLFLEKFGFWYLTANLGHAIKFLGRLSSLVGIIGGLAGHYWMFLLPSLYFVLYNIVRKDFDKYFIIKELTTLLGELYLFSHSLNKRIRRMFM